MTPQKTRPHNLKSNNDYFYTNRIKLVLMSAPPMAAQTKIWPLHRFWAKNARFVALNNVNNSSGGEQ